MVQLQVPASGGRWLWPRSNVRDLRVLVLPRFLPTGAALFTPRTCVLPLIHRKPGLLLASACNCDLTSQLDCLADDRGVPGRACDDLHVEGPSTAAWRRTGVRRERARLRGGHRRPAHRCSRYGCPRCSGLCFCAGDEGRSDFALMVDEPLDHASSCWVPDAEAKTLGWLS